LTKLYSKFKLIQISKFEGQKGRGLDHVTYFYIFWPPLCLWNG